MQPRHQRMLELLAAAPAVAGPASAAPPEPGDCGFRLGKYLLRREIGHGGMGTVYEAEDTTLRRRVAIKIVREGFADGTTVRRLHREAAIAAGLRHPAIVGIHEVGTLTDTVGLVTHFIAMDYVEGRNLAVLLAEGGTPSTELVRILEDVARAVDYAHRHGVVHRDLKPANVIVDPAGRVVLTDFGLARADLLGTTRLTQSDAVMGTPYSMAPEQVEGRIDSVGARTDVWGLGVMLYEMLTGDLPFRAGTPAELFTQILRQDPVPIRRRNPRVDPALEMICLKALEKNPARRYATAGGMAQDLARCRRGDPVLARPIPPWRRLATPLRVRGVAWAAVAAVAVLAGAALAMHERRELAAQKRLDRLRRAAEQELASCAAGVADRHRELRQASVPADRARRELEALVRDVEAHVRPDRPQAYYVAARARLCLGRQGEAVRDLRAAVESCPDFRPGWTLLGMLLAERHGPSITPPELMAQAAAALARGVAPADARAQYERWGLPWNREEDVLARVSHAMRLRLAGSSDEAAVTLKAAWGEYRAEEYAYWLGNWSSAPEDRLRWYAEAIAGAPGYDRALIARAILRRQIGDERGAEEDLERARKATPAAERFTVSPSS